MGYCKPISEFSLFDEFKPGEFKSIDFLRKNFNDSCTGKNYLKWFRTCSLDFPYREDDDGYFWYLETFVETNEGEKIPEEMDDEYRENMEDDGGFDAFTTIYDILKEKGYIRTDNFQDSYFIANIIKYGESFPGYITNGTETHYYVTKSVFDLNHAPVDKYYENIKPTTKKELKEVFKLLKQKLPRSQYEMAKFYLLDEQGLRYTKNEYNCLCTALWNFNRLGEKINAIYDGTLLS